ncbi:MAG: GTPase ObgE [Deltaproteobacteria bacterium]|nr:GTPase ObgE [Deltaproteobacteria bacterium]
MRFIDEVEIEVIAGKGGDGCIAFRREKYVPRGGPSGGDGGRGGSVIFKADAARHTLLDLRYRKKYRAEKGQPGRGKDQNGRAGKDTVIPVPTGTIISDLETGDVLGDLLNPGQLLVVARGGRGGRGNMHFATSTLRAPRIAEPGRPGESRRLKLELKLLADVGVIGLPNAGKSTLISRISKARPKIADYPFTTLVPNLGVVKFKDHDSFVVADVPGLVEGSSTGAGLGHRFLKHIERCRVLLHLVEAPLSGHDPVHDLSIIEKEIGAYNPELIERPRLVAASKADLTWDRDALDVLKTAASQRNLPFLAFSAVTGQGLDHLLAKLWDLIKTGSYRE